MRGRLIDRTEREGRIDRSIESVRAVFSIQILLLSYRVEKKGGEQDEDENFPLFMCS